MRHQKRHHSMDVSITVRRDRRGYLVKDFGQPKARRSLDATVVDLEPTGIHIVGKTGDYELVTYSFGKRLGIWKKVRKVKNPAQLAKFMTNWGPIGRSNDDGSYERAYDELKPAVDDLQSLGDCVECGDAEGFKKLILGRKLFDFRLGLDNSNQIELVSRVQTLFEFMIFEMWTELNLGRVKICEHCKKPFLVGSRGSGLPRQDSKYHPGSCRNSAYRERKRMKAVQ